LGKEEDVAVSTTDETVTRSSFADGCSRRNPMPYLGRGVLGAALLAWLLTWFPNPQVNLWELPRLLRELEDNHKESADLDERDRATLCRTAEKRQVARDLAQGRTTLTEAAARIRELDRAWGNFPWETFRRLTPGDSDEERHCREVIGWVRALVEDGSEDYPSLVEILEAELQGRLDGGTLALPLEASAGLRPTRQ
jgi:hypothetical protein